MGIVRRSLWNGCYSLDFVDCGLVAACCCRSVADLLLFQSIAMILIRCMHLRKNFHSKASSVAGGAAGGNLNRPPPLPILTHAQAPTSS